jgi:hypothetical protein
LSDARWKSLYNPGQRLLDTRMPSISATATCRHLVNLGQYRLAAIGELFKSNRPASAISRGWRTIAKHAIRLVLPWLAASSRRGCSGACPAAPQHARQHCLLHSTSCIAIPASVSSKGIACAPTCRIDSHESRTGAEGTRGHFPGEAYGCPTTAWRAKHSRQVLRPPRDHLRHHRAVCSVPPDRRAALQCW